jgi:hypothetical protein
MKTNKDESISENTKAIISVLLLIFIYPIGLIVAWFWVKWPMWLKIVVTLPVFVYMFLLTALLSIANSSPKTMRGTECIVTCMQLQSLDKQNTCLEACADGRVQYK